MSFTLQQKSALCTQAQHRKISGLTKQINAFGTEITCSLLGFVRKLFRTTSANQHIHAVRRAQGSTQFLVNQQNIFQHLRVTAFMIYGYSKPSPVVHWLVHKARVQSDNSPNRGTSQQEQPIACIWMCYAYMSMDGH